MLAALGVEFEALAPDVEELREGAGADELVLENARRKAAAGQARGPAGAVALGVDTEVVLDGRPMGKAQDPDQARQRLEALSGRAHEVLSAVVLLGLGGERSAIARSQVSFHRLDEATIRRYLDSGEWRDRAGAYAIQGLGSTLVAGLQGDFANVVGLPLGLLIDLAPELFGGPSRDPGEP